MFPFVNKAVVNAFIARHSPLHVHDFEVMYAEPVTLFPTERKCRTCDLVQRSEVVWRDVVTKRR